MRFYSIDQLEARIAGLESKIKRLRPLALASDEFTGVFSHGVGKMTRKQAQNRQAAHDRQRQHFRDLQEAEKQLRWLKARHRLYLAGEVHLDGQPCADAPSRQRQQEFAAIYAEWVRSVVKPGDKVQFVMRPDGAKMVVKRLNQKTVTFESGTKWKYTAIRPLTTDGLLMSDEEVKVALLDFMEIGS